MRVVVRVLVAVSGLAALVGCGGGSNDSNEAERSPNPELALQGSPQGDADCPGFVAAPMESVPDDVQRWSGGGPVMGGDALWMGSFNPEMRPPKDGVWSMKIGWYRSEAGKLDLRATRETTAPAGEPLDEVAGNVPDGYGETGFQASSINLSSGCWHLLATLGDEVEFEMWLPIGI